MVPRDHITETAEHGGRLAAASPWLWFLLWLGLYQGLTLVGPQLPVRRSGLTDLLALALFSVLAVALLRAAVEIRLAPVPAALVWAASLIGWLALRFGLPASWGEAARPLADALLIVVAVAAGVGVGRLVPEAGLFAVVMVVAGVVDILGVTLGPVALALQRAPELVHQMSVQLPRVGAPSEGAAGLISVIGMGDFLFLGLMFGAVRGLHLDLDATSRWTVALLVVGLGGVLVLGAALPGLVFICGAGLIANWRFFRFTPDERKALLIAGALFVGLLALAGWWLRRAVPPPPSPDDTVAEAAGERR